MSRKQGPFIPVPGGEATTMNPDGATCVYSDNTSRNSLTDAWHVHGGPTGSGYGAFNRKGGLFYDSDRGAADVTTATPRRKPDYGA